MIEYVDTAMLVFILSTIIFLVKKTTTLCHDVEALKSDSGSNSEVGFWRE